MQVTTCSGTTRSGAITSKNSSINSDSGKSIDWPLLVAVASLVGFGLLMVYSSSFIFAQERYGDGFALIRKQVLFALAGFLAMWLGARIPFQNWYRWSYLSLGVATLLLVMVFIPGLGARVGGAQRWIRFAGINVQPGEIAKFALVLFSAFQLTRKRMRLDRFGAAILSSFILTAPAILLLLKQPDFGSVVIVVAVIFSLMYLAGVPKEHLFISIAPALVAASFLILSTPYRRARLMTFLDPWKDPGGKGFQILQSMTGLQLGGVTGVGLGNGKEKLFYLPEAHNDFILAVIGEELGFIGVAAVVAAFLYLIYRGLRVAWQVAHRDQSSERALQLGYFGMLLATGITLVLGFQGLINIAVVIGLVPTKGLTLPFISYGGSALLIDLFCVGVLLNISKHTLRTK